MRTGTHVSGSRLHETVGSVCGAVCVSVHGSPLQRHSTRVRQIYIILMGAALRRHARRTLGRNPARPKAKDHGTASSSERRQ